MIMTDDDMHDLSTDAFAILPLIQTQLEDEVIEFAAVSLAIADIEFLQESSVKFVSPSAFIFFQNETPEASQQRGKRIQIRQNIRILIAIRDTQNNPILSYAGTMIAKTRCALAGWLPPLTGASTLRYQGLSAPILMPGAGFFPLDFTYTFIVSGDDTS